MAVSVDVEVVGDFSITIHIEADLVIVTHTSDAVPEAARPPMDPDVFARQVCSFGNRPGDLFELTHASVQRQQAADGCLAGLGLVAVKEPTAGFVDLGDGGGRGVAIARDAILHGLAPDGVTIRPLADEVFVRFHAAVGFDGGDADMLGRFPTMKRFRALGAVGRIAHVPGEIRREARGLRAG